MSVETICASAWEYHAGDIPVPLDDVVEVIAEDTVSTEGYGQEDIVGLFRLKDGRFLYVSGGCDTTGWDCRSSAKGEVRATLADIVRECCTDDDRSRLKIDTQMALGHNVIRIDGKLVS
jgi:hypothetical protein